MQGALRIIAEEDPFAATQTATAIGRKQIARIFLRLLLQANYNNFLLAKGVWPNFGDLKQTCIRCTMCNKLLICAIAARRAADKSRVRARPIMEACLEIADNVVEYSIGRI